MSTPLKILLPNLTIERTLSGMLRMPTVVSHVQR